MVSVREPSQIHTTWRGRLRKLVQKTGLDVCRFEHPLLRQYFERFGINVVFDVGANVGFYGRHLRSLGFDGRIVSFEPLSSAYARLEQACAQDPRWEPVRLALGDSDGEATLHIAGNTESSSLLDMLPAHSHAVPESAYLGSEVVQVRKLDTILDQYYQPGDRLFIKMDTQGFEARVVEGAKGSLHRIVGFQAEMSLMPLYAGGTLIGDFVPHMHDLGYDLVALEAVFVDPKTGHIWQLDGIFFKRGAAGIHERM